MPGDFSFGDWGEWSRRAGRARQSLRRRGLKRAPRRRDSTRERGAHSRDRGLDVAHDQCRIQPQNAISAASEHGIAARIRACLSGVMPAIDLDDEALSRRQKVSNEPTEERNLAAKHDAKATPANAGPKQLLGRCE